MPPGKNYLLAERDDPEAHMLCVGMSNLVHFVSAD